MECDEGSELEAFCCCCIAWLEDSCLAWLLTDDEGVAVPVIPDGRNIKLLMMLLFWLLL